MSHADIQYLIMKFRKMNVRARTEMAHNSIVKTNGGVGNINWKMHKIISTDDKKGERKTSHSCCRKGEDCAARNFCFNFLMNSVKQPISNNRNAIRPELFFE